MSLYLASSLPFFSSGPPVLLFLGLPPLFPCRVLLVQALDDLQVGGKRPRHVSSQRQGASRDGAHLSQKTDRASGPWGPFRRRGARGSEGRANGVSGACPSPGTTTIVAGVQRACIQAG